MRRVGFSASALLIIMSAFASWFVSFSLHNPLAPPLMNNFGFKYNDIIYGVLNPRFNPLDPRASSYWYRVDKLQALWSGGSVVVYPYVDYMLEYPPFIGLLYFISVNVAYSVVRGVCGGLGNSVCYSGFIRVNYMIHSSIILVFYLATALLLVRILWERVGGVGLAGVVLYIVAPSTIIYMVYNWDIICGFFTLLSAYLYVKNRLEASALALSMAVLTKLIPILIVLTLTALCLARVLKREVPLSYLKLFIARFLLINIVSVLIPLFFIHVVNPNALMDFYRYHSRWYCENCIYQFLDRDIFSVNHRFYSLITVSAALSILIFMFSIRKLESRGFWSLFFLVMVLFVSLSYISSPQMILLITPFIPLVWDRVVGRMYLIADLANAAGILVFFKDMELRTCLYNLGFNVEIEYNPWVIPSPTQILFMIRNILLLTIAIYTVINVIRGTRSTN